MPKWLMSKWFDNKQFICAAVILYAALLFFLFPAARGLSSSQEARGGIISRNMIESGDWLFVQSFPFFEIPS